MAKTLIRTREPGKVYIDSMHLDPSIEKLSKDGYWGTSLPCGWASLSDGMIAPITRRDYDRAIDYVRDNGIPVPWPLPKEKPRCMFE